MLGRFCLRANAATNGLRQLKFNHSLSRHSRIAVQRYALHPSHSRYFSADVPESSSSSSSAPPSPPRVNLMKLISRAGVASRRGAIDLIHSGRVTVDGKVLSEADSFFISSSSRVAIDGKPFLDPTASASHTSADDAASNSNLFIPSRLPTPKLWLYHKAPGLLVSHFDKLNRPTVFQQIQKDYFPASQSSEASASPSSDAFGNLAQTSDASGRSVDRFLSVGRLDYLSEGLLLLTNSGGIQRFLEHPSSDFERTYRVKITGTLSEGQLQQLRAGLDIDGFQFKPVTITQISNLASKSSSSEQQQPPSSSDCTWYEIRLHEGKNRELRTLMNYFNYDILNLIRVGFHDWQLNLDYLKQTRRDGSDSATVTPRIEYVKGVQPSYALRSGELVEVEWTPALEARRVQWAKDYEAKEQEKRLKRMEKQRRIEQTPPLEPSQEEVHPTPSVAPTKSVLHQSEYNPRWPANTSWDPPASSTNRRKFHSPTTTTRRFFSTDSKMSLQPSLSSHESDSIASSKPKRTFLYPEETGFFVVPEKASKKEKEEQQQATGKNARAKDPMKPKAWLQRGAPKPRELVPTPICLSSIHQPWMSNVLTIPLHSLNQSVSQSVNIAQWTGMYLESDHDRIRSEAGEFVPQLCLATQDEIDAGSGSIVWDAALHLLHHLFPANANSLLADGPVLELGSGTGVLSIGSALLSPFKSQRFVMTDHGPVLRLLRHNVEINSSVKDRLTVCDFDWARAESFMEQQSKESNTSGAFRTILCSELLDSIPSAANGNANFREESLQGLARCIQTVAQASLRQQAVLKRADAIPPRVDVWFTGELRGVFQMNSGNGSEGLVQKHLLKPLQDAGAKVEQVFNASPYTRTSPLVLFRITFE